jgi:putative DNA primase/helicase
MSTFVPATAEDGSITPAELAVMKRWVAWQEEVSGSGKSATKVPYSPHGAGKAKSDAPDTWGTRDDAKARAAKLPMPFKKGGVGVMLGDLGTGWSLGGIDLDTCRSGDGTFAPWAKEVISLFTSYTEVSPSGTGCKVYFTYNTTDLPALQNAMGSHYGKTWKQAGGHDGPHPPAIELHLDHRYFAWTGDRLPDSPADLRPVVVDTVLELIHKLGPEFSDATACIAAVPISDDLKTRIEAAANKYPKLAQRWKGDWSGLKDNSRSAKAMSLGAVLKIAGFTPADVEEALRFHPDTAEWASTAKPRDFERIYDKAGGYSGSSKLSLEDGVLSETAVAEAFAKQHADDLRYDHDKNAWYSWTGRRWKLEKTGRVPYLITRFSRDMAKGVHGGKALPKVGKSSFATGVECIAKTHPNLRASSEIWDSDDWLLATPEGTVDLTTGKLLPAKSSDYITKLTGVAPADTPCCPQWLAFLDQATQGNKDYIAFLRRWFGYTLTGCTREQALLFVYGDGGNGKGVTMNTVDGVMGDYAVSAALDTFMATRGDRHPTDIAMLAGARMVMSTEIDGGQTWAEARLKSMTGGDPIRARFMRQDFFEFTPKFKLTISGNHQPALRNVDAAARRRFNLAPFIHRPASPDPYLGEKLKAEWPAILRWMIEGCLEWQNIGLQPPEVVKFATEEYFAAQDTLTAWASERCDLDQSQSSPPAPLLTDYNHWAQKNGEMQINRKAMKDWLEKQKGIKYKTIKGKTLVQGIGLKQIFHGQNPDMCSAVPDATVDM